jgi:uncharacterized small protein (TIGR04563 family)
MLQSSLLSAVPSPTLSLIPRMMSDMNGSDKRKQSLYFPEEMLKEIGTEAMRQDRSMSWIVQKSWKAARKDIMSMPSVNDGPIEEKPAKPAK